MLFTDLQKKISQLVANPQSSFGKYLAIHKELIDLRNQAPSYFRKIRVAFLGAFTLQGLPEIFSTRAVFHNLLTEVYLAPYSQISQDILNPNSGLYSFQPDIVYLITDSNEKDKNSQVPLLIEKLLNVFKGRVVILENFYNHDRVSVLNFQDWLEKSGNKKYWYTKYKDLGDLRLALDAFPDLAEALMGYAVVVAGNPRKCLILDLDNTLWQGVVGEDGVEKIIPDKKLQNYILSLMKQGIILAINSKNNLEDAMEAIEKHPAMVLRKNNFAAWRINWQNKDLNMRELAEELNLGLDSFVFVDDDSLQRAMIQSLMPEVAVVPPQFLESFSGFTAFKVTEEDARRGQMYVEDRQRRESQGSFENLDEFLSQLKMEVAIVSVDENNLSRVSQLTQKTNQFNLTTHRYSEEEIKKFLQIGGKVWALKVRDKFGDYGLTGVVMAESQGHFWRIDNLLLSCRVLGRGVENALMAYILEQAKKHGASVVRGEYISTKKNKPCENFLADAKFKLISQKDGASAYEYDLSQPFAYPHYLTVKV